MYAAYERDASGGWRKLAAARSIGAVQAKVGHEVRRRIRRGDPMGPVRIFNWPGRPPERVVSGLTPSALMRSDDPLGAYDDCQGEDNRESNQV